MKVYDGFEDPRIKKRPRSVAVGVFDGVHRGHQKIIADLFRCSRALGTNPIIVTFEPHPAKVLEPDTPHPILMSLRHRLRLFEGLGVTETLVVRFTKRFSRVPHDHFLKELLVRRLGMRSLSVGRDFRFGRFGAGDKDYLSRESRSLDFKLALVAPARFAGRIISSTRIRKLIRTGRLSEASRMLGRPVSVYGTVVRGHGRGRSLGFPTANLNPHHETLPPPGVYAAWGLLAGKRLGGVLNLGPRPTFSEKETALEVHFLNFHGRIYGRELEMIFVRRLRPVRRFGDRRELSKAILSDVQRAGQILKG